MWECTHIVKSYNVKYFLYHPQQIAVLSVVYFTAMGYILHGTGIVIYQHYNRPQPYPLDNNINMLCFLEASSLAFSG